MIIRNPHENVLAFGLIDWAIEGERTPNKELNKFLNKKYGNDPDKVVSDSSDKLGDENEESNDDDKEYSDGDDETRQTLLNTEYSYFSIGENDEILLSTVQYDCEDGVMLFVGKDAAELLLILKKCLERRSKQLQRLLGNNQ